MVGTMIHASKNINLYMWNICGQLTEIPLLANRLDIGKNRIKGTTTTQSEYRDIYVQYLYRHFMICQYAYVIIYCKDIFMAL